MKLKYKNEICVVYGEGTMTHQTCQKWFSKLHPGDFFLDDHPWSYRLGDVFSDQIETLIENSQHCILWEIANIFKISKSGVENHLHQLGYVTCFDVWGPHKLSEKNLLDHISACNYLLKT